MNRVKGKKEVDKYTDTYIFGAVVNAKKLENSTVEVEIYSFNALLLL